MADFSKLIKGNPNILDLLKIDQEGSAMDQSRTKLSPEQEFLARPGIDLEEQKRLNEENNQQEIQDQRKLELIEKQKQQDAVRKIRQKQAVDNIRELNPENEIININQKNAINKIKQEDDELRRFEDQYEKESLEADLPSEEITQQEQQSSIEKPLSLMERYKDLQQKQLDAAKNAQFAKASNLIMQGMLTKADPKVFENQRKMIDESLAIPDLELKQMNDQISMQSKDPQSEVSKYMRSFVREKFGQDIPDTLSAYDLEQTSLKPMIQMQMKGMTNQLALAKFQQQIMQQDRQFELAQQRRQDSENYRKQMLGLAGKKADISEESLHTRQETSKNRRAMDFKKDLVADKAAGGAIGQVGKALYSIERAEALIKPDKLGKVNLNPLQMRELSTAVARVISGGGTTAVSQIEELTPHTVGSNTAKVVEWLTNEPKGANQQKFVHMFKDMLSREKQVLNEQRKQFIKTVAPAHQAFKKENPELYKEMLEGEGLDENLNYVEPKIEHPQDTEAIEWAKNKIKTGNPQEKDQALQILKMNNILGQ